MLFSTTYPQVASLLSLLALEIVGSTQCGLYLTP